MQKASKEITGYLHPGYALALEEFGTPRLLPRSRGWLLERSIPGCPDLDGMGCYPIFSCQDWSELYSDLEELQSDLVTVSLVTDPFGDYNEQYLRRCFRDVVIRFKDHFIVDLGSSMESFVHRHHKRNVRKAFKDVYVEKCENPLRYVDEWIELYRHLIQRHSIKGIPAFSKKSFTKQFNLPGIVVFRALHQGVTVGMILWLVQNDVGYYHLGAFSHIGYKLRASYALFWSSIGYFQAIELRWLNLGGGAGVQGNVADGLSRFKAGWSTGTRPAYFCGRILNRTKYFKLMQSRGLYKVSYFPSYRIGEFGSSND